MKLWGLCVQLLADIMVCTGLWLKRRLITICPCPLVSFTSLNEGSVPHLILSL
jgi:hypothetical protein